MGVRLRACVGCRFSGVRMGGMDVDVDMGYGYGDNTKRGATERMGIT